MARRMYHGTRVAIQQILAAGGLSAPPQKLVEAKYEALGDPVATPAVNGVYLTENLGEALAYALGGDVAGRRPSKENLEGAHRGRYGYLIVVEVEEDRVREALPDEDWLGHMLVRAVCDAWGYPGRAEDGRTEEARRKIGKALSWVAARLDEDEFFEAYSREQSNEDGCQNPTHGDFWWNYDVEIILGKLAMPIVRGAPPTIRAQLVGAASNLVLASEVKIAEVWRIDLKKDAVVLERDGSNLFEVAKQM
jgi:hypothetical protein